MNALLSAVVSDLAGRLVSFLVRKYQEASATDDDTIIRLQRALLRARVIVEEADGRQIANRAMLQQLGQLRRELCRAAYALDAFMWRDAEAHRRRSHSTVSRRSRLPSRPPSISSSDCAVVLPVAVGSLEAALSDMREFVLLLSGCPRVTRQPYSAYLFMESCMFGRQMEMEEIIGFLLSQPSSQDLDVLPIVGPRGVGKRTLVEHVCLDERVRQRFAKIHRLSSDELTDDLRLVDVDVTVRSLMVVYIADDDGADAAEESWQRFHSAAVRLRRGAHSSGSKVIVISRTEAHSSSSQLPMGTAPPLRLRAPRREELWYFFRALAFGAANPDERPELARVAMEICETIRDFALFAAANTIAASLRADVSARAWRRVLGVYARVTPLRLGGELCYVCRPVKGAPGAPCLFYNRRKLTGVDRSELPEVTLMGLISGSALPPAGATRFDVITSQSRIPPYGTYVATCDMERARHLEKRARKRRRDQHDNHQPTRV
ncbi:hypothetical protein EJB05_32118, partial [Eragrostis curvula]